MKEEGKRLRQAGHLHRMSEERLTNNVRNTGTLRPQANVLEISEQIGALEVSCAGSTGEWIRPDNHHSNPQLWVNSQCRAAAMLVSGAGGRVNLP